MAMFNDVIQQLTASYRDPASQLNHLQAGTLPRRSGILEILDRTKNLLFPDHLVGHEFRAGDLGLALAGKLAELQVLLAEQTYLARTYALAVEERECRHQATADALAFIKTLPSLRKMLALDVQAALDGDPAAA